MAAQIGLIGLVSGERIPRLTELQSERSLEKKLASADVVVRQKEKRVRMFEAALALAEATAG